MMMSREELAETIPGVIVLRSMTSRAVESSLWIGQAFEHYFAYAEATLVVPLVAFVALNILSSAECVERHEQYNSTVVDRTTL
jgi:hypothetical protein